MNTLEKFHCRLALELRVPLTTVLNMSVSELRRWREYFNETPFSSDKEEYLFAQIAALIFNTHYVEKRNTKDFLPWIIKNAERDEAVNTKLEILRAYLGG